MSFLLSQDGLGRALLFEDETYFPSTIASSSIPVATNNNNNNNNNNSNHQQQQTNQQGLIPSVKPFGQKVSRIVITFEPLQKEEVLSEENTPTSPSTPQQASPSRRSNKNTPSTPSPTNNNTTNTNTTTATTSLPSSTSPSLSPSPTTSPYLSAKGEKKKSLFRSLRKSSLLSQMKTPFNNLLQQMNLNSTTEMQRNGSSDMWTSSAISVVLQPNTGNISSSSSSSFFLFSFNISMIPS